MTLRPFEESVLEELRDPEFAAAYLQVALEDDGMSELLIGLRMIFKANGGLTNFVEKSELSREMVSEMLSETGNPDLRSFLRLLTMAGIDMKFKARRKVNRKPKPRPTKESEIVGGK